MKDALRILIVEDNAADADFIRDRLPAAGPVSFQIETVARLSAAVDRLERNDIDLVLLDLGLPDSQGLPTFHRLQKAAPDVPMIVLTGTDNQELAVAAVRDGAQDYLVKGQIGGTLLARAARYAVERQRAAQALRRSEARQSKMVANIGDVIVIIDRDGVNRYTSPNVERWFGWRADDVVGVSVFFNVHPRDLDAVQRFFGALLREPDASGTTEYRYRCKDGSDRWIEFTGVNLLHDADIRGILGNYEDITERRRTEEEVRRLAVLADTAPNAISVHGFDGRFFYANQRTFDLHGYSREEFLAMNLREIDAPADARLIAARMEELVGRGEASFEVAHVRKDGTILPMEVSAKVTTWGGADAILSVATDITDRRQAEDALRALLREKEALIKEVHHRVKNNLQVINSLLRLESARSADSGTRSVLTEMQGRIRAMALLHETLYGSGTFAAVDLGAYLKQLTAHLVRAQAVSPGSVHLDMDIAPVEVAMDQAIPCGLLVNELVSNCLRHGFPDGRAGQVRVELQPVEGVPEVRLRVSDTGVGLPEDFETKRRDSLGLQLVSDLARQLRGSLEIGPGPAAVFTVTFPVAEPRPVG